MRRLRWIEYVMLRDHNINEEIRKSATVQPITTHLMQKRLRCHGHVRRRDDSHMTRTVLDMELEGVRPRGRPTLRYMDTIRRDSIIHIVNMSIRQGIIPDDLKRTRVIPIHKKGRRTDPSMYRHISIRSYISKVMEKVIHDQESKS